jgi:cysteine desulfurase / selenocysteine lyase
MVMNLKTRFKFFRINNFLYLDSSATTQKPNQVVSAVKNSLEYSGNPHRGAHIPAVNNEEKILIARENIARFINCNTEELVFTTNTTDSVNLAVDSITENIKKGDEILISIAEHHSNMLPFNKLIKKGAILKTIGLKDGVIDINDLKKKISKKTKIVSLQHCSNVLGNINDVEKAGKLIKKFNKNILYMVDGAQSIAHVPVDVTKINCDFYSFSGHKMYGPDGIGVLFISKKTWPILEMVRMGGGTISDASIVKGKIKDTLVMDKFNSLIGLEGGTPNVANIIGLSEAVKFIRKIGFDEIQKHEKGLVKLLLKKLSNIEGVKIYGPKDLKDKIGVVSFSIENILPDEIGKYLNKRKICIRYGSHCAFPLINELGCETIRISLGVYNDEEDIERVIQEIQFYLDKKKGLIKNKNLEEVRDQPYYKNILPVQKAENIIKLIKNAVYEKKETEIIIQAGHFLAIPDIKTNSFYPSIKPLLPEHLYSLLDEFGMTTFPLFTWELGCKIVSELKKEGIKARLMIAANDTTGINELKNSSVNKSNKSFEEYRKEYLDRFGNKTLPDEYLKILKENSLSLKDVLKFGEDYFTKESLLRGRFKEFIDKNKSYFEGMIDYTGQKGVIDVGIKVLDNQNIKTCRFNTFNSKTGGRFCIVEVTQLIAEMFGKSEGSDYTYLHRDIKNPKSNSKNKIFVMLTPEMCNTAVTSAGELYVKLFAGEKDKGSFRYFNFQFGPDAEKSLAIGLEGSYISNKGNLIELDLEEKPEFGNLWKLIEYNLLYDAKEYSSEVEELFSKLKINKKSNILDTCVGPGFFSTELLEKGYNLKTADISKKTIGPFVETLKEKGINHKVVQSSWLELPKHFKKNSFDMLFNRGNSFTYANGGFLEKNPINKKKTIAVMKKTLKIYYDLLKTGGYLYIDKYKDSEVPSEKIAARLNLLKTKEKKDIIFKVERNPEKEYRFASIILRDEKLDNAKIFGKVYDLTENEMEDLLKEVGFKVEKLKLKSEQHFVVWLAKK